MSTLHQRRDTTAEPTDGTIREQIKTEYRLANAQVTSRTQNIRAFFNAIDPLVTFDLAEDHRRGLTESVSAARFAIFVSVALGHASLAGSRPGWGLHPKYP